jgi:hypothetical protein
VNPWELELSRLSVVATSNRVLTAVRGLAADPHPEPFADFLEVWLDHEQPVEVLETLSRTLAMMLPLVNGPNDDQVLFVLACVVGTQSQHPGPFVVTAETTRVCRPIAWAFANIVAALHRPTVRAQSSAIDLLSFMDVVGLRAEAALQLEAALEQIVPQCREVAANTLAGLRD